MNPRQLRVTGAVALVFLTAIGSTAVAAETPLTRAIGGFQSDRGLGTRRAHEALQDYLPDQSQRSSRKYLADTRLQKYTSCCEFRIFEARTRLFDDFDRDGYYTYLRLSFDVDTDYAVADVYADVYLVDSLGQFTRIYESELFTIYGNADNDDYEIEAELVAGFPSDDYDVFIEIYDAFDDRLVVEYGALDSPDLSLLPMEDISFDTVTAVVYADGGGGSTSLALLALLLSTLLLRRFRGAVDRPLPGLLAVRVTRQFTELDCKESG